MKPVQRDVAQGSELIQFQIYDEDLLQNHTMSLDVFSAQFFDVNLTSITKHTNETLTLALYTIDMAVEDDGIPPITVKLR